MPPDDKPRRRASRLKTATALLTEAPADSASVIADYLISGMNRRDGHGPDDIALLVIPCTRHPTT